MHKLIFCAVFIVVVHHNIYMTLTEKYCLKTMASVVMHIEQYWYYTAIIIQILSGCMVVFTAFRDAQFSVFVGRLPFLDPKFCITAKSSCFFLNYLF